MSREELAAWRFLASHRVGELAVTHITFIDGDKGPTMNTPSIGPHYASVSAHTWGDAATALAKELGWSMECGAETRESEGEISFALSVTRQDGGHSASLPATPEESVDSTTGATGADQDTGVSIAPYINASEMARGDLSAMQADFPDLSRERCIGLLECSYRSRLLALKTHQYLCPHGFLELTACQECRT